MRPVFLATVLGLAVAGPGSAQHLSLTPHIGFYIPTEQLYQLATSSTSNDFKLEAGPSFGARLGLWFGNRLGIEVGGSYVPTTFQLTGLNGGSPVKQDAKLFIGSGQAVLFLIPRTSFFSLYLSGGVGVVSRGGVAFTKEASTSDLGGTFGAGAGINLGFIQLTAGADLVSYKAKYLGSTAVTQELKQKDVALKLGFGIPFGGGGGGSGGPKR
jgi:hypothetical protein